VSSIGRERNVDNKKEREKIILKKQGEKFWEEMVQGTK
jgi:hypothetical protein